MVGNEKLVKLSRMIELVAEHREQGRKVVYCHGIFDLLHIGHIRFFERARQLGDILVVTVSADEPINNHVDPVGFAEKLRAEAISSLHCVDLVAVGCAGGPMRWLRQLKPDLYVKGAEFKDISEANSVWQQEKEMVVEIGVEVAYVDEISFTSTNLINRYLANASSEMDEYLELFRQRYKRDQIFEIVESMKELKVLVIGDAILDEYQYCEALGKSSKDPVIALQYLSQDLFAGGVLAIANHLANFAGSVQLVSVLGSENSHEEFIRSQLHPEISVKLEIKEDSPTLIKRRFLDGYSLNKLFEVYVMDDGGLPVGQDEKLRRWLREQINDYDLVLAADFGHGTISPKMVDFLTQSASFLAVNTQANAGNRGFHTISRYPRADYISLAEHELRLETRNLKGDLRPQMSALVNRFSCRQFAVTRGRNGCAISDNDAGYVKVPAFARTVVDRVGSGDAFLAISSLASVLGVNSELLGFLGNAVGSLAVEILGNRKAIARKELLALLSSLT